jgi:signal transduction histidine kinase
MTQVFDNICANAVKHGFTDDTRSDYSIRIDLLPWKFENGDVGVCISIANNGAPLSSTVVSEKIYTWGVSSNGTGIGAYEVKGIIEAAGGSVDFESNPDEKSGYCVKYKLMLPLIRL